MLNIIYPVHLSVDEDHIDLKEIPLHRFDVNDITNTIKKWAINDIKYKTEKQQIQDIFIKSKLSGKSLVKSPLNQTKEKVQKEILQFMTLDTLDIIFEYTNQWKTDDPQDMESKTPKEIAHILYNIPLYQLISKIKYDAIDGEKISILFEEKNNMIQINTGWNDEEIEQIKLVLLKYRSFTKKQFVNNMDKNHMNKNDEIIYNVMRKLKKIVVDNDQIDIEMVHYNINHSKTIESFSDEMINLVEELMESHDDIDLVQRIYTAIARCFICNDKDILQLQDWSCTNCGNYNFPKFIDGKLNHNTSFCTLCGITQVDAVVLILRNYDSYVMVNNVMCEDIKDNELNEDEDKETKDDIDILIENVIKHHNINLFCLYRTDNKPCPAMLRLSKTLIKHKRWLQRTCDKLNDITATVKVDVAKFINNTIVQDTLIDVIKSIKHKRFTPNHMQLVLNMVDGNVENIADIKTYLEPYDIRTFSHNIRKHTEIKPAFGNKIFNRMKSALKRKAQKLQFEEYGEVLSDLNVVNAESDYHHILKSHINDGNENTVKNAFRFFSIVVHYQDTPLQIEKCLSIGRRIEREQQLKAQNNDEIEEKTIDANVVEDKQIWTSNQYYKQNLLDVIHSYLVHSNWKHRIKEYTNQLNQNEDESDDDEILPLEYVPQNSDKFMSLGDYCDSLDDYKEFGFGVKHCHPELASIYQSIYHV